MRRKDGARKLAARRTMPEYLWGFRTNPSTAGDRHPACDGIASKANRTVLSLFAGCGGLDLGFLGGFRSLGALYPALRFDVVAAIDNSDDAIETYRLNIGDHCRLADLTQVAISSLPSAEILIGGFPCQDFSSSGPKVGLSGKRGQLYKVLVDYMEQHKPAVVVGENVPHLARLSEGAYLETILKDFEATGYRFEVWELYGPDYGLPQSRRRLFLVGVRNDLAGHPQKPIPTHKSGYVPIDVALKDLESVTDEKIANQSQYYVATRATSGGGQGDHTNRAGEVAYCIRANARGRIQFHYRLDRRLTVRECARLQSFPDEFIFPYSTQRNLTLIGNAVPPVLGYRVASAVEKFMGNLLAAPNSTSSRESPRHRRAQQLALLEHE